MKPTSKGANHTRTLMAFALAMMAATATYAQEDPEYKMEVGGGLGLVTYMGDYNGNPARSMQPMVTLMAKYRPNPRMAWAAMMSVGKLKGDEANTDTWYPRETPDEPPYTFSHQMADIGLRFEYNFWPYGTGREYRGAKRLTPFMALGLGVSYANPHGTVITGNAMLGAGVKYKVATRLNLTAEWNVHFSGNDNLDGRVDPYGIKRSGLFKNTDGYSVLRLSLTYDIWAKCKTCNNDRD